MGRALNHAVRIFEGVPKFAGEVFHATKAPTLILLAASLINLDGSFILLTILWRFWHWPTPFQILIISLILSLPADIHADLTPQTINLIHNMTPFQLAFARGFATFSAVIALIATLVFFWWVFKFSGFLLRRFWHEPYQYG
jgi:hypothetical protein